ncbi:MAG: hypothetical protein HRT72_10920, partial [Flavobacteriales bacterium]|nr:hypothetical protein [Flavobacteriales bacterium]
MMSSYIGTSGTEWLVDGGFQVDGTLVLVGITIGPKFDLKGVDVKVLGKDGAVPKSQDWSLKKGKFKNINTSATVFIVRLSSDLKKVISASRFPWASASLSGFALDKRGNIYLSGRGKERTFTSLSTNVKKFEVPQFPSKKKSRKKNVKPKVFDANYIAKLNFTADKIEWIRHSEAVGKWPQLRALKNGNILYKSVTFDTLDANGNRVDRLELTKPMVPGCYTVNEVNGEFAYGHEHHWPTGREPWRCPVLKIFNSDKTVKMHLYDWPGPLVGINRSVSDSSVRNIQYMEDGNLLYSAWSDGGNSVMTG